MRILDRPNIVLESAFLNSGRQLANVFCKLYYFQNRLEADLQNLQRCVGYANHSKETKFITVVSYDHKKTFARGLLDFKGRGQGQVKVIIPFLPYIVT